MSSHLEGCPAKFPNFTINEYLHRCPADEKFQVYQVYIGFFFIFVYFWTIPCCAQWLILSLHSEIVPDRLGKQYGIPGIELCLLCAVHKIWAKNFGIFIEYGWTASSPHHCSPCSTPTLQFPPYKQQSSFIASQLILKKKQAKLLKQVHQSLG